jgi:hypothetical protein
MRYLHLTCGLITFGAMSSAWGVLSLTMNYANFGSGGAWSSLNNDAWDGSTTDATKQAAAEAVMDAAADYWQTAFAASSRSLSLSINVSWGGLPGATLAQGGAGWTNNNPTYTLRNPFLTWDNDGSSTFFVDLTPNSNSEWAKSSLRTDDLGGGTINVERVYYNAASGTAARDNSDMLSVAIHEIGHTLGLLPGYPRLTALDVGSDGDLDLSGGTEIAASGGHLDYSLGLPETPGFPFDGATIGGTYYPTSMGPSIVTGTRKLLTGADILVMSDLQGLSNPNTNPLIPEPEPSLVILFSVGLLLIFRRRGSVKASRH